MRSKSKSSGSGTSSSNQSDCVRDIVACMKSSRSSRVTWLVVTILLFVIGFVLIMFGGFRTVEKADKKEDDAKEMTSVTIVGALLVLASQISWFVLLLKVILDKSQIRLAQAIDAKLKVKGE